MGRRHIDLHSDLDVPMSVRSSNILNTHGDRRWLRRGRGRNFSKGRRHLFGRVHGDLALTGARTGSEPAGGV